MKQFIIIVVGLIALNFSTNAQKLLDEQNETFRYYKNYKRELPAVTMKAYHHKGQTLYVFTIYDGIPMEGLCAPKEKNKDIFTQFNVGNDVNFRTAVLADSKMTVKINTKLGKELPDISDYYLTSDRYRDTIPAIEEVYAVREFFVTYEFSNGEIITQTLKLCTSLSRRNVTAEEWPLIREKLPEK